MPEISERPSSRVCVFHAPGRPFTRAFLDRLRELEWDTLKFVFNDKEGAETDPDDIVVDGAGDDIAVTYRRIEAFAPSFVVLENGAGLDEQALLYVIAEVKEIPVVHFLDVDIPQQTWIDPRAGWVALAVDREDRAASLRRQGVARILTLDSPDPVALREAIEGVGLARGNVPAGKVTERPLPFEMRERLLLLAALFRGRDLLDESDMIVEGVARVVPWSRYDVRRFAGELLSAGLPEAALLRLDKEVEENPTADVCVEAANLSRDLGLHREAVMYAIRALEINPAEERATEIVRSSFPRLGSRGDAPETG